MGDQIGIAVDGTLYYVPIGEFNRIRNLEIQKIDMVAVFSNLVRLNTLYMIASAGSGHIGSSFSSMEIVCWLLLEEMRIPGIAGSDDVGDIYFSSKGHDAPGYYAALIGAGKMNFELIHKLRRINGLPGHPDIGTEYIETNTGSLGMGISKAKGMVTANRLQGNNGRVFVLTGDGELQEGQFWESLVSAANNSFVEITVIVDHNKLQSDTYVSNVSDLGDLEAKFSAFGWHVERMDGHDLSALSDTLNNCSKVVGKPKIIIADTIKGRGVSFMEHTAMKSDTEMYRFHSGAPDAVTYIRATQELIDTINAQLSKLDQEPLSLESIKRTNTVTPPAKLQKLISAYSSALVEQADKHKNLVALDADLILDTGLIPFSEKFPNRFIECGIAEQDMVSQAGGMALKGLLPVVHSFACFLSTRPNEQIYNNATEHSKVVYVGSLAGVVPGGPGHSHQSVRDISALAGMPKMSLLEPCTEVEVEKLLDWCLGASSESSYMRLVSLPWPVPFTLSSDYKVEKGRGIAVTEGNDAVLFSYGPVMLTEAYKAASILKQSGIGLKVVNLPWLNQFDSQWLADAVHGYSAIFTLDNHYIRGGQGDMLISTLGQNVDLRGVVIQQYGIKQVPVCGTNDEVLKFHRLDAENLVQQISSKLEKVCEAVT